MEPGDSCFARNLESYNSVFTFGYMQNDSNWLYWKTIVTQVFHIFKCFISQRCTSVRDLLEDATVKKYFCGVIINQQSNARLEPRTSGWEALILPLCYAATFSFPVLFFFVVLVCHLPVLGGFD